MLNFEDRVGPFFNPPIKYPDVSVPAWWKQARFGIFIHWGLYSLPAWAEMGVECADEASAYKHHSYAEWIANTIRIPGSPAGEYFTEKYGLGTSYEDLAMRWQPDLFNPEELVQFFQKLGARYLIPTAKHHDGFCLWDTNTTSFNAVQRGPKRDLIADFSAACEKYDLSFGIYYSGALDWHVSNFPALTANEHLFSYRRNDRKFADYCAAQWREIINRFNPKVMWNDIEWPDAGKDNHPNSLACLLQEYQEKVPDGVVNDRFGIPVHGHLTREYNDVSQPLDKPWEATRGLAHSFGYNQLETETEILSGEELIRFFTRTITRGGNVLLNIGLTARGTIPELYYPPLEQLRNWLELNKVAVWDTIPDQEIVTANSLIAGMRRGNRRFLFIDEEANGATVNLPISTKLVTVDGVEIPCRQGKLDIPTRILGRSIIVTEICGG